jgi:dTDP-4-dehydrorhamnose 3,5-epimerase
MIHSKLPLLNKIEKHITLRPEDCEKFPSGVHCSLRNKFRDKRGFFMEVCRDSQVREISFQIAQVSFSETKPKVRKAFHLHRKQADIFCPLAGYFRIVLVDLRKSSATFRFGYSILTNPRSGLILHIPPLIAHGYEVLRNRPASMLYLTNREYNPLDEFRIKWNDPEISFPW